MNLLQRLWLVLLCERAALKLVGPTTLYHVSLTRSLRAESKLLGTDRQSKPAYASARKKSERLALTSR
jgi:hypothetical protein